MRLLLFILLSVSAGWGLSAVTEAPPPPVPPERWQTSSLLEAYRKADKGLHEAMFAPVSSGPVARWREALTRGEHDRAGAEAQKQLGKERIVLEGTYSAPGEEHSAGSLRLRIACPGKGKDCCPVSLTRKSPREEFQERRSSSTLLGEGHLNERGNLIYADLITTRSFEENLPFAGALWEIPLGGERETPLMAFDLDRQKWREVGPVRWEKRALSKYEECQW